MYYVYMCVFILWIYGFMHTLMKGYLFLFNGLMNRYFDEHRTSDTSTLNFYDLMFR